MNILVISFQNYNAINCQFHPHPTLPLQGGGQGGGVLVIKIIFWNRTTSHEIMMYL